MLKNEEMYTNICLSMHNLDISLNENIKKIISETIEIIYNKISKLLDEKYKNILYNEELFDIIKQCFIDEEKKYLTKYDSINLENIKTNEEYLKYIKKQETKVEYDDKILDELSKNIFDEINKYLKDINGNTLFYQRDISSIKKEINQILLKELENYFLKTTKTNILSKASSIDIYDDVVKNYNLNTEINTISKSR